jgi:hypothetical protein
MTQVIIRHRLVTWFEEFEDRFAPGGLNRRERIAHMGDEVDIPEDEYQRLLDVNTTTNPPFYTDEQAEQIRVGTYRGFDSEALFRMRSGQRPPSQIEPVEGEGYDTSAMTAEDLGEYIRENNLTVQQTVDLAGDDTDSIEKVLDAENYATDNSPRVGVTKALEAKLSAAAQA